MRRPPGPNSQTLARIGLAAALLLAAACGPRFARETVFDAGGTRVILRSERRDGGAVERGYAHPTTIAPVRLAHILGRLEVRPPKSEEGAREPAVPGELVYTIGQGLSKGLEQANPDQQVVVMATRRERRLGIFTRELLTSLVAYVEGERLHLHLGHRDWTVPRDAGDELPEPWVGRPVMGFRILPADGIATSGPQSVAVVWRDPRFAGPGPVRVTPGGRTRRRTILMESPLEEPDAPAPGPDEAGAGLAPETLRALADLEEARRRGEITESEYQERRAEILAGSPDGR